MHECIDNNNNNNNNSSFFFNSFKLEHTHTHA